LVVVVPVGAAGVAPIVVAPAQLASEDDVETQKLAAVFGSPFGFTVPFNVVVELVTAVAAVVVTVGVAAVVKFSTAPYVVTPNELVASAW
jgi:hypothetical protein